VLGIPAAFPKPFNDAPPDKNTSPSVKIVEVGPAVVHSSVIAKVPGLASFPPADIAAWLLCGLAPRGANPCS